MKSIRINSLFVLLLCTTIFSVGAKNYSFQFEPVVSQKSFPTNEIRKLYQDRDGYIWIPTYKGLLRYDGYTVSTYNMEGSGHKSFINKYVNVVEEDYDHNLWIGTNNGLYVLNKINGEIQKIEKTLLETSAVEAIVTFSDGDIWVGLLVCRKQSVKRGVFFTTIPNASSQNVVSLQQLQRVEESKWSHYLLSAEEIDYLHRISQDCFPLSKYLSSAPGVVTAANSFFIVDDNTIQEYDLHDYARPIVQRATGLLQKFSLTKKEFNSLRRSGQPTNLLDFSKKSIPILSKAQKYLEQGELKQLDQRYKMLKRDKWYIIPNIPKPAEAFFFKRCHLLPKFMKNDAHILTTDAAYGIHMKTGFSINSLLFSFFNSLTLTWAELNGRFYGGGVLELTPSEFKSLPIYITNFEEGRYSFFSFNIQSKEEINDFLETQDQMILSKLGLSSEDQEKIRNIREKLQKKRLRY